MSERIARVLVLFSFLGIGVACGGTVVEEDPDVQLVVVTDPCTGETVGYLDRMEDRLLFVDGLEVDRRNVKRLDASEKPVLRCEAAEGPLVGASQTMAAWAGGGCWRIEEAYVGGSASCEGCCSRIGGAYSCWEACVDIASSR
jgi:hypothetical protein